MGMENDLMSDAKNGGIEKGIVEAIVINEEKKILLIENLQGDDRFYHLPEAVLRQEESLPIALERAVGATTGMGIREVVCFVGHYDKDKVRHFFFVVRVNDPYSIEEMKSIAYAWLDTQEAVGYPIHDELREMLDLYNKGGD